MTVLWVPLGQGQSRFALIDEADAGLVLPHRWNFVSGYAAGVVDGRRLAMHRHLLNAPRGMEVDHRNGDGLDNRRANLRLCTRAQNAANLTRHPKRGYRGVRPVRDGRWRADIIVGGEQQDLGRFDTAEDAARAYDAAARERFGEFARLHFPEPGEQSVWRDRELWFREPPPPPPPAHELARTAALRAQLLGHAQ